MTKIEAGRMLNEKYLHDPILINTVGHTAGLLLFAVIIALLVRDGRAHGLGQTKMSLIAAFLAFVWNVGALVTLALPHPGSLPVRVIMTASFSLLSLLPAVLLHVAVQGRQRAVVLSGYAFSSCAVMLHFSDLLWRDVGLHQSALLVIAIGFDLLTLVAFALRPLRRSEPLKLSDWLALSGLLLFSSSFLHFGYQHVSSPWAAEIAWHHIGIPVALIVLLQDYRFLLLDTFIRFLVNSAMAAVYVATFLFLNERFPIVEAIRQNRFIGGLAVVTLCLSLILFAYCRNVVQGWVGRVIFHRQDVETCLKAIASLGTVARTEEELLTGAASHVAEHLRTSRCAVLAETKSDNRLRQPAVIFKEPVRAERVQFSPQVQIPLRVSTGSARLLVAGARYGGQRYLSEDLEDMRRLASAIEEQLERFRAEELRRLVNQAELRALQAQINPHFLFNALNTLYGVIDRTSVEARRTVLNLSEIFRYFLQGNRTTIPLSEELKIVQAYLEIEGLRLGSRLKTEISIDESVRSAVIPILSIQPLVENAVKHGIALKSEPGLVRLRAERTSLGVRISIQDTGVGFEFSERFPRSGTGLGLENVRQRLNLCYGAAGELEIHSNSQGTSVTFLVPDHSPVSVPVNGHTQPLTA